MYRLASTKVSDQFMHAFNSCYTNTYIRNIHVHTHTHKSETDEINNNNDDNIYLTINSHKLIINFSRNQKLHYANQVLQYLTKGYETEQNIILVVRRSSTCKDCANTNLCKSLKLCVLDERKTEAETLDPRSSTLDFKANTLVQSYFFFSPFCISVSPKKVSGRTITERRKGREREKERKRGENHREKGRDEKEKFSNQNVLLV